MTFTPNQQSACRARRRHMLLGVALASMFLSGCSSLDIERMILEQRENALYARFEALDDCARVEFVRGLLVGGRHRDPVFRGEWPSDRVMLRMLDVMGMRTGISFDATYFWCSRSYDGDGAWLTLVEPWRAVLGCGGVMASRAELLRMSNPLLAEAVDSLMLSPAVRRALPGEAMAIRFVPADPHVMPSLAIADSLLRNSHASGFTMLSADALPAVSCVCRSLLPSEGAAQFVAFYDVSIAGAVVMKIVRRPVSEGGDYPTSYRDGLSMLLLRRRQGSLFLVGS